MNKAKERCPFCGSPEVEMGSEALVLSRGTFFFTFCSDCSSCGPPAATEAEAWSFFNQRTPGSDYDGFRYDEVMEKRFRDYHSD